VLGIVGKSHLLGLEDAVLKKTQVYSTTVIVSEKAELDRIDREFFCNTLR
jgi:hypothetical protein